MPSLPLTHQDQALQHSYANSNCLPCHISGRANSCSALFNSANCLLQLRVGPDLITGLSSRLILVFQRTCEASTHQLTIVETIRRACFARILIMLPNALYGLNSSMQLCMSVSPLRCDYVQCSSELLTVLIWPHRSASTGTSTTSTGRHLMKLGERARVGTLERRREGTGRSVRRRALTLSRLAS